MRSGTAGRRCMLVQEQDSGGVQQFLDTTGELRVQDVVDLVLRHLFRQAQPGQHPAQLG